MPLLPFVHGLVVLLEKPDLSMIRYDDIDFLPEKSGELEKAVLLPRVFHPLV